MTGEFCRWCGQSRSRCDEACAGAPVPAGSAESAPTTPRFCPTCGRRLTVYVTPGHFVALCRDHGEV